MVYLSRKNARKNHRYRVQGIFGETNTDDLSPAPMRGAANIPLHALAMLKNPRDGALCPIKPAKFGPINRSEELKANGNLVAYVGDVGWHRLLRASAPPTL